MTHVNWHLSPCLSICLSVRKSHFLDSHPLVCLAGDLCIPWNAAFYIAKFNVTSGLQGSVKVHRGALLLVPQ